MYSLIFWVTFIAVSSFSFVANAAPREFRFGVREAEHEMDTDLDYMKIDEFVLMMSKYVLDHPKLKLPWTLDDKSFILYTEKQMNWLQAVDHCHVLGMRLASINNQEEQNIVEKLIIDAQRDHNVSREDFWIAGSDIPDLGNFKWATTDTPLKYSNWNRGEPNNAWAENHRAREHCVSMVYNFNYRWNDSLCGKRKYLVCEIHKDYLSLYNGESQ